MSTAASAENTMKFLDLNHDDNIMNNNCISNENKDCEDKDDKIFFKNTTNDSDDDMVVIILEEDINIENNEQNIQNNENDVPKENNTNENENEEEGAMSSEKEDKSEYGYKNDEEEESSNDDDDISNTQQQQQEEKEKSINVPPKQKYIGVEVYTHLQQTLELQKMYPLLPCNMISSFARVMEYVEYFDIPSEERKKLVVDLVKILAYSNNEYGSRDCFEYFVEHNMIDDIIKTIVDSTKNRYDINRFPHTNRKIVLSCVSLSNKIKIVKPSAKIESLFEELKLNLCGLKRFFKTKEKEESKQT